LSGSREDVVSEKDPWMRMVMPVVGGEFEAGQEGTQSISPVVKVKQLKDLAALRRVGGSYDALINYYLTFEPLFRYSSGKWAGLQAGAKHQTAYSHRLCQFVRP
jgi:hypothetical protein